MPVITNDKNVLRVCTWWCSLLHTALRLACMQRWLHPDNVWQFPPSAGRPHPPRRSRKFLMCHHGNHPNTPITEKFNVRNGRSASTHFFCSYCFYLLKHTVTSMLMMSPSWSGRLQQTNIIFDHTISNWGKYFLSVKGFLAHTCQVCRDRSRCSQMCTLISGSPRI